MSGTGEYLIVELAAFYKLDTLRGMVSHEKVKEFIEMIDGVDNVKYTTLEKQNEKRRFMKRITEIIGDQYEPTLPIGDAK